MTAKSDDFENGILLLLFNNSADASTIGAIGSGIQASSTAGSLWVALHSSSPGEAGTQSTNELGSGYAAYGRQSAARSGSGWTVSADTSSNAAALTFGQRTETSAAPTASHVSVGVASTGATAILYHGALDSSLVVNTNVNPQFAIGALDITEA